MSERAVTVAVRGPAVDQRDLAERLARTERRDLLTLDLDRRFAALDDEEHQSALAFERDLVACGEASLVELLREALEILLVEIGEQADLAK